jgi:hypothetical protein
MRKLLLLVVASLSLVTCGGGGSSGPCQEIGNTVCQKACACRDGSMCAVSQGGVSIEFPSESDCKGWFVTLGCSQGAAAAYNDADACLPLVQAATCTGSGTDGALEYPSDTACQTPQN